MKHFLHFLFTHVKEILIIFILLYLSITIIKFGYCSLKIKYGKSLKKSLLKNSYNRSKLNQLYSQIKEYCKAVQIQALHNMYGIPADLLNKTNYQVQQRLLDSIDEAIGIYIFRRRYSYVLLPINKKNKAFTAFKVFVDAIIKIATAVIIEFLKSMIFN